MLVFLDTEFTDLVVQPRLLSVGLVADWGAGGEFYAEVTDPDRIGATNRFGLSAVIPQFGKVARAACSYAELGSRLSAFLTDLAAEVPADGFVELAFGYDLDWTLVDLAAGDSEAEPWEWTRRRIRPVNVYELTGYGDGRLAAEAYFRAQALAPFARHHALCDARALRLAYGAATREAAGSGRTAAPMGEPAHRTAAA